MKSALFLLASVPFWSAPLWWTPAAEALSLRTGLYWGGGSRYIAITKQGNRICYQGYSPNGSTVASVYPVNQKPGLYRIHRWNTLLTQPTTQKLLFDSSEYTVDGAVELTPGLRQCLQQRNPFFRTYH